MAEKLFNEYYTKRFDLPGRFTAMNGAIQYFKLTVPGVVFDYKAADDSKEEALKAAVSQANYLRALEVLRTRGPQPIITSVEGSEIRFTVEQTWAFGDSDKKQVSEHYGKEGSGHEGDPKFAYEGLKEGAENDIKALFANIKWFDADLEEATKEATVEAEVVVTAGSLNANS